MLKPLVGKKVYLCLDNDKAGKEGTDKIVPILESLNIDSYAVKLPEGVKDVCEYFASKGLQALSGFMQLVVSAPLTEPETFAWETNTELLAADLPPVRWLVENILPSEGFCFFVGPEASGKSFYTLSLAQSVAYGRSWLDQFPVTQTGSVLFIDKENTRAITQSRLKGLGFHDPDNRIYRVRYPEKLQMVEGRDANYSRFMVSLSRKVKKNNIKLLIVDSLTDLMLGDENARDASQAFFDSFRELFPGLCVLVLHHSKKAGTGPSPRRGELFRGSSNIIAQITVGFLIDVVKNTNNEFILEQVKNRDAAKLQKFKVNLVSQRDPADPSRTFVEKIMYAGVVEDEAADSIQVLQIIKDLLDSQEFTTRKEIDAACEGFNYKTIDRTISSMRSVGLLDSDKDPLDGRKYRYFKPTTILGVKRPYNNDEDFDEEE